MEGGNKNEVWLPGTSFCKPIKSGLFAICEFHLPGLFIELAGLYMQSYFIFSFSPFPINPDEALAPALLL